MSLGEPAQKLLEDQDAGTSKADAANLDAESLPDATEVDAGDDGCGRDGVMLRGRTLTPLPAGIEPANERLLLYDDLQAVVPPSEFRFPNEQVLCADGATQPPVYIGECGRAGCELCVPRGHLIDVVACPSVRGDNPATPVNEGYFAGFAGWGEGCSGWFRCRLEAVASLRVEAHFELGTLLAYPMNPPPAGFPQLPEVARVAPGLQGVGSFGYDGEGRAATVADDTQGGSIPDIVGDHGPILSNGPLTACAYVRPNAVAGGGRTIFGKGGRGTLTDPLEQSSYALWMASEGLGAGRHTYLRAQLVQAPGSNGTPGPVLSTPPDLVELEELAWSQVCLIYDGARLAAAAYSASRGAAIAVHDRETLVDPGDDLPLLEPRPINPTPDQPFQVGNCASCPFSIGPLGFGPMRGQLDHVRLFPYPLQVDAVATILVQPRPPY